jgi:nitrite reductase/ring-hydroxylating ferredoxin subunit
MGRLVKVANVKDVPSETAMVAHVEGRTVALFNVDGTLYAVDDTCTHEGGPLSDGEVYGTIVTCPWHGACFDLTTGEAVDAPADEDIARYEVHVQGDDVKIEFP